MSLLRKVSFVGLLAIFLAGCNLSLEEVTQKTAEVKAEAETLIAQTKSGFKNLVAEAKNAYDVLLIKKQELEVMIKEVREMKEAIDQLLGNNEEETELSAKKAELEKTLAELKNVLAETKENLAEEEKGAQEE